VPADRRHLVLCGLSGAGKSTVGPLLAQRLGRPFVDVDHAVEDEAGRTVREIFAREGERAFRARERAAVVRALATAEPAVIALGGGALEDDASLADALEQTLVWLDAPVRVLVPRIGDDRPLLAGNPEERLAALAAKRAPRYGRARVTVDATRPPDAVVAEICVQLAAEVGA
jgi:shikimate kinase